jgi:hypothetical protein
VPDSLITAFKTKHGRVVYDGAGIMPDIKTPNEKFSNVLMTLISKNHIFNYATKYFLANSKIPTPTNFKLSDEAYNDFITLGGESKVKEAGKLRVEGKEYIVKDGDIMHFRFNV